MARSESGSTGRTGSRPMRAALLWQAIVTLTIALVATVLGGKHAAVSAVLGGLAVIVAGAAYVMTVTWSAPRTAGETIRVLLRAEAVKIGLIVLELWLVFTLYRDLVPVLLIGTLIVTVLLWPVALLYRD